MADPQQIIQSQTSIPDYARAQVERMLGATEGAIYDYQRDAQGNLVKDASGAPIVTGLKPYQQYQGQRIAGPDVLSQQAYQGIAGLGVGAEAANALQNTYNMAAQAGTSTYSPTAYGNQYQAPAAYTPGQFTYDSVAAAQAQAAQLGESPKATAERMQAAQLGAAPTATAAQGVATLLGQSPEMRAAAAARTQLGQVPTYTGQQLNYTPQNIGFERAGAERVSALPLERLQMQAAGNVGTGSFTAPGAAQAFMSPYMQNVVDIQQREAQRQADIASTKRGAGFAQAGAFGGTRQAVENAEAARNLATQKGDIQAQGLQSSYQQAQQQFNAEQQAALQAALANQQVQQQTGVQNLSALLQTQGLGAQTGLQAQTANQQTGLQALLANQATGVDTSKFNQTQQYNAALQNAQMLQQQQLANQSLQGQYGLTQGQMDQALALQNAQLAQQAAANNQQYAAQYGLKQGDLSQQMAMANLSNQQQTALANQALQGQYGLTQAQMQQAANAANQQAGNQIALANQSLAGQYGLTQGQMSQAANLQNAQMQQQASLANQQAAMTIQQQQEAANQYGYGQNMAAAANAAQYGQAANQLQEQAKQYGAGFGLQALNTGMQGMQNYANLGANYNNQQMNIANAQNQMGTQAQNYQQQQLTQNYNDFLNQQNFPFQQIGQLSNVLRGVPLTQQTQAVYQQAPSLASQAAGFGTAAIGAANLFAKAEGGMIRQPRGLSSLILARMH